MWGWGGEGAVVEIVQVCKWLILCLLNTNVLKIEKFKHFAFPTSDSTSVLKVDSLCPIMFSNLASIVSKSSMWPE